MKKILATLLFISLASNVFAQTPIERSPEDIIKKLFPKFHIRNKCYHVFIEDPESEIPVEETENQFCIRSKDKQIRQTSEGKLMYWLFIGPQFDFKRSRIYSSNFSSGYAQMLVLKETAPNHWQLWANTGPQRLGRVGIPPQKWSFHQFGPEQWGFMTTNEESYQGFTSDHFVIYHHNGGQKIGISKIGAVLDNRDFYGDTCESREDDPKDRQDCLDNILTAAKGTIQILNDNTTTPTTKFYPLEVSINGFVGKKRYRQEKITIAFNSKKGRYEVPKNYPLTFEEFFED